MGENRVRKMTGNERLPSPFREALIGVSCKEQGSFFAEVCGAVAITQ